MSRSPLDDLLTTLDVRLNAFALCDIQSGYRLAFEAMDAVVVHYVLAGRGSVHQQDAPPVEFGPHSMLVVAPRKAQSLAAEPVAHTVQAETSCRLLADGLVKFIARDGEGVDGVQGFDAAGQGAVAFNRKIIDFAQRNVNSGFDLAKSLAGAKNLAEMVELQAAYWQKLLDTLTSQAEEVRALATKMAAAATEPVKEQVKRGVDELGKVN